MTQRPISVLLVEDDRTTALVLQAELGARSGEFTFVNAAQLTDALILLAVESFDVAVVDLNLPDEQGLATLSRLRAISPQLPIVVLTSAEDEALAIRAIQIGAQDYQVKAWTNTCVDRRLLARSIHYAIQRKRIECELQEARVEAEAASAAKGEFLAGLAQELNVALAKIQAHTEALAAAQTESARSAAVRTIQATAGALRQTIASHLEFDLSNLTGVDDDGPETGLVRGLRILLADDSADNQRLIGYMLRKAGAEVIAVDNGQLAIDAAFAANDAGRPFDLVLTDLQMPVMDGWTAAAQLRDAGFRGPIIALSANPSRGDRQRSFDAGCSDYLAKPLDRARLLQTINRWVVAAEARG